MSVELLLLFFFRHLFLLHIKTTNSLPQTTDVILFLENGQIRVAETSQERSAANTGRSTAEESDLDAVACWKLINGRQRGISDLRQAHVHKNFSGELLQTADVYRALLARVQITAADTQVRRGTDHATSKT